MASTGGGLLAEQYPPLKELPDHAKLKVTGHAVCFRNEQSLVVLDTGHVIVSCTPQTCRGYGGARLSACFAYLKQFGLDMKPLTATKAARKRLTIASGKRRSLTKELVTVAGIRQDGAVTANQLISYDKVFGVLSVLYEPDDVYRVRKRRYPLGSVIESHNMYLIPFNLYASPALWKIVAAIFGVLHDNVNRYKSLPDASKIIKNRDKEAARLYLKSISYELSVPGYKHCTLDSTGALFSMGYEEFFKMHRVSNNIETAWHLSKHYGHVDHPMLQWNDVIERWRKSNACKSWKALS